MSMFRKSVVMLLTCFKNEEVLTELKHIDGMVTQGQCVRSAESNPRTLSRSKSRFSTRPACRPVPLSRFARSWHHGHKPSCSSASAHRRFGRGQRIQQGDSRLRHVPDAACGADEEPGSDRADGCDGADRPACDLQPGRANHPDQQDTSKSCSSPRVSVRPGPSSAVPSPAPTRPFPGSSKKFRSSRTDWLPCLKAARRFWSVPA
jgi:hypothetical protein